MSGRTEPAETGALVIGIGNPLRGDDGIGPAVITRLARRVGCAHQLRLSGGDAAELLDAWHGFDQVIVVDAAVSGAAPGTVHRIDAADAVLPATVGVTSSHGFGLAAAVELGRALGRLPARLVIYAVEARQMEDGAPLSAPVARAADQVTDTIRAELDCNDA